MLFHRQKNTNWWVFRWRQAVDCRVNCVHQRIARHSSAEKFPLPTQFRCVTYPASQGIPTRHDQTRLFPLFRKIVYSSQVLLHCFKGTFYNSTACTWRFLTSFIWCIPFIVCSLLQNTIMPTRWSCGLIFDVHHVSLSRSKPVVSYELPMRSLLLCKDIQC